MTPVKPGSTLPSAGRVKRRRVPSGYGREDEGELPFDPCEVDGCEREAVARGLCPRHYKRWQRGRPLEG